MASNKKTYVINNLFERLYTITLYFKKGVNSVSFLENIKKVITEENVNWHQNTFSFMSKESHSALNARYNSLFNSIKESGEWDCFLNYKLSFKNFNDAITLFTIIEPYVKNNLDLFIEKLKERINDIIKNISPNLKLTFGIKDKSCNILSYALINDQKLLITINNNLYNILNIAFADSKKMFDMSKKERNIKLSKDRFVYSYLFAFHFNKKDYAFKEFLNTCKICKNYHTDFYKKKCVSICVPCGVIKETIHVCGKKSPVCGLCKIYLNKELKHVPLSNACEHKKNIHVAMFINTRQKTLIKIFQKKIKTINNTASYVVSMEEFPVLK